MMTSGYRRVSAVGWMTAMAFVWAIFVPAQLSNMAFALIALAGLFVTFCGAPLLSDSQAPRPAARIPANLEAQTITACAAEAETKTLTASRN